RASVVTSDETARLTRLHNDSNVLALGGRTNAEADAVRWLGIWLETPFEGGRHVPRLQKIREYELAHSMEAGSCRRCVVRTRRSTRRSRTSGSASSPRSR